MSHRRRRRSAVIVATLLAAVLMSVPASAAEDEATDLEVTLTSLQPATLTPGEPVTLSGSVTNRNDHTWSNVQAYLVLPRSPFTTRGQVTRAIASDSGYTGERIYEELESIDDLGDIAPAGKTSFSVTVPWESLGITGAEGVYPIGIQLLGTRPDGQRSNTAIARATTFIPLVSGTRPPISTSVLWSFMMPITPDADGVYGKVSTLVSSVSSGGRLRNLLDLVASTSFTTGTILVDPALLDGLADIAAGIGIPADRQLSDSDVEEVETFLADLVTLMRRGSTWITGYGLPDQQALAVDPATTAGIRDTIDTTTSAALHAHGVSGRRTTWVGAGGPSTELLSQLRGAGDMPFIVRADALPDWSPSDGSFLRISTPAGPVPAVISDDLSIGLPGVDSAVTLRQRLLSEAALASLQQQIDPSTSADAVAVVPPSWDPGEQWRSANFDALWAASSVAPATLDDMLLQGLTNYEDGLRPAQHTSTIPAELVSSVASLRDEAALLADVTVTATEDVDAGTNESSRLVASLVGLRWRDDSAAALQLAEQARTSIDDQLDSLNVEGPPSFILSGSEGQIPLTVTNPTNRTIEVGLRVTSTNPQLQVPDIEPVQIAADSRNTVNVPVDVGNQSSTSLTVQLISGDGVAIGQPAQFNVRSSKAGLFIWVAIGIASALVVVALARRLLLYRRRGRRESAHAATVIGPDDE